jgi:hypothetical protein
MPAESFSVPLPNGDTLISVGCLPRTIQCGSVPGAPAWDGSGKLAGIVREEIDRLKESVSFRPYRKRIIDQNGYSSCAVCATANAIEHHRAAAGRSRVDLDWLKAYQELVGGRGGVPIDTMMHYSIKQGFPVVGGTDHIHVTEACDLGGLEAFWTALARGFPVVYGWYFPAGAHAECAIQVKATGGRLVFPTQNSHGEHCTCCTVCQQSTDGGVYPVDERDIAKAIPAFGAFAILETELRQGDTKIQDEVA